VAVRFDRVKIGKGEDQGRLAELFGAASAAIHRMYESGSITQVDYELIYGLLEAVAGHLKAAERIRSGQLEMELRHD